MEKEKKICPNCGKYEEDIRYDPDGECYSCKFCPHCGARLERIKITPRT